MPQALNLSPTAYLSLNHVAELLLLSVLSQCWHVLDLPQGGEVGEVQNISPLRGPVGFLPMFLTPQDSSSNFDFSQSLC